MGIWQRWFARSELQPPADLAQLDEALAVVRRGQTPSIELMNGCNQAFQAYYDLLCARYGTEASAEFGAVDRPAFWACSLKLAAIEHPNHYAWPYFGAVRPVVLDALGKRLQRDPNDLWMHLAAITPALLVGDVPLALTSYEKLKTDPFLESLCRFWVEQTLTEDYADSNNPDASRAFIEAVEARAHGV